MSGTDRTRDPTALDHGAPIVILVEPQLGENIGAAARAMLNFGLTRMRIVRPRDGWPNYKALNTSSGAESVLEEAEIFGSTTEAILVEDGCAVAADSYPLGAIRLLEVVRGQAGSAYGATFRALLEQHVAAFDHAISERMGPPAWWPHPRLHCIREFSKAQYINVESGRPSALRRRVLLPCPLLTRMAHVRIRRLSVFGSRIRNSCSRSSSPKTRFPGLPDSTQWHQKE